MSASVMFHFSVEKTKSLCEARYMIIMRRKLIIFENLRHFLFSQDIFSLILTSHGRTEKYIWSKRSTSQYTKQKIQPLSPPHLFSPSLIYNLFLSTHSNYFKTIGFPVLLDCLGFVMAASMKILCNILQQNNSFSQSPLAHMLISFMSI